jgi:hypothetical protein
LGVRLVKAKEEGMRGVWGAAAPQPKR